MKVGKQIKMLRISKKMTIKQLADKTDVSIGFISNIERDINSPTVSALQKICTALDVDLASFFNMARHETIVCRKEDRQKIEMPAETGLTSELMSFSGKMAATYLSIAPGMHYGDPFTSHKGDEICLVLEGTVEFGVGAETYELHAGDCIYVKPMMPHRITNPGESIARTFAVTLND